MELTYVGAQTVPVGGNAVFDAVPVRGNGSVGHREGSGLVTLRGVPNQRARYLVRFWGNIAVAEGGTVGPVSVALSLDGEPLGSATAIVTPAAVGDFFNVSGGVYVDVTCGCCVTVAVRNTSATPIDVSNLNLIANRVG